MHRHDHNLCILFIERLSPQIFTTKFYVQKEIEYNFVSTQGSVNQSTLDGWEGYLQQFRDYIIKGTHFSNFAVQAREKALARRASACVSGFICLVGASLLFPGRMSGRKMIH